MPFSLTKLADVEISNIGTADEGNLQNKDNLIIVQDGLIKQARASQISLNQIKIGEISVGNISSIDDNYITVRSGLAIDKGLTVVEQTHLKGGLIVDGESTFHEKLIANKGAEIAEGLVVTGATTINGISSEKFENIDNKIADLTNVDIVESNKINYPTAFAVKKYVDDSIANVRIECDSELSETSTNPVQNKIITNALNDKSTVTIKTWSASGT